MQTDWGRDIDPVLQLKEQGVVAHYEEWGTAGQVIVIEGVVEMPGLFEAAS
jgi:hypothetical protein